MRNTFFSILIIALHFSIYGSDLFFYTIYNKNASAFPLRKATAVIAAYISKNFEIRCVQGEKIIICQDLQDKSLWQVESAHAEALIESVYQKTKFAIELNLRPVTDFSAIQFFCESSCMNLPTDVFIESQNQAIYLYNYRESLCK